MSMSEQLIPRLRNLLGHTCRNIKQDKKNNTSLVKACPKTRISKILPILTRTWVGRPRSRGSTLGKENDRPAWFWGL